MILTAHQTGYLPWLGWVHKVALADVYVHYWHVQYKPKHTDSRNKIRTQQGWQWLTVPCRRTNHFDTRLCDVKTVRGNYHRKHRRALELAYRKAPYFDWVWDRIGWIYEQGWDKLIAINSLLVEGMLDLFGVAVRKTTSTDLDIQGAKADGVLEMCLKLGATTYVFGANGRKYMGYEEVARFTAAGVRVVFQDYQHPVYPQVHGEFIPYLSALDLLMNVGPDAKEVLMAGNRTKTDL